MGRSLSRRARDDSGPQVLPLTAEQVLSYVQDLPGLVAVDQDRAKALLRRFLAPVVLNPTDDGIEAGSRSMWLVCWSS